MSNQQPAEQIVSLLIEVLAVVRQLVPQNGSAAARNPARTKSTTGIYPHQSKYNPWRAYVWDAAAHKNIYIGAFPSVNKAKAAQRDFRCRKPITSGTRAARPLLSVAK